MQHYAYVPTRRGLLKLAGFGAAALCFPIGAASAALVPLEQANLTLVREFCDSWETRDLAKITAYLSEGCVYRGTETAPSVMGRAAIIERLKGPVSRAEKVRFEILDTYARGPIVVNDRLDYFTSGGQDRIFHAVGVFFIADGKIAEWTDYVIRDT